MADQNYDEQNKFIPDEKLNWRLTVDDGYYLVSYHQSFNRVHV